MIDFNQFQVKLIDFKVVFLEPKKKLKKKMFFIRKKIIRNLHSNETNINKLELIFKKIV